MTGKEVRKDKPKGIAGRVWKDVLAQEIPTISVGMVAMLLSSSTVQIFPSLVVKMVDLASTPEKSCLPALTHAGQAALTHAGQAAVATPGGQSPFTLLFDMVTRYAGGHKGKEMKLFLSTAAGILCVGACASFIRTRCFALVKERTSRRLRQQVFGSLLAQEKAFFDKTALSSTSTSSTSTSSTSTSSTTSSSTTSAESNEDFHLNASGSLLNVLVEDVNLVAEIGSEKLVNGIRYLSSIMNGSAMLLILSPKLTLVSFSLVPAVGIGAMCFAMYTKKLQKRHDEMRGRATAFAQERLAGLSTVRLFAMEAKEVETYTNLTNESLGLSRKIASARGLFMGSLFLSANCSVLSVLYFGSKLAAKGEIAVSCLTSFVLHTALLGLGFSGMARVWSDLVKAKAAAGRVFDVIDRRPEIDLNGGHTPSTTSQAPSITFDNVHFSYPARPESHVLNGFSLTVKAGQVVALVGASGGGKTTVASLLARLYEIQQGSITYDGHDTRTLNPSWLRRQIGVVEQEPALFSGSVYDNIAYAKPGASEEEVVQAAKDANAHEFIMNFENGYQTLVGQRGQSQLSGGQKQRVAIARAFLKNPAVLVLDEATSALDNENERVVQQALQRVTANRTVIIIAHRISTIEKADNIVVLEGGAVVEQGTFTELSSEGSVFQSLHELEN